MYSWKYHENELFFQAFQSVSCAAQTRVLAPVLLGEELAKKKFEELFSEFIKHNFEKFIYSPVV